MKEKQLRWNLELHQFQYNFEFHLKFECVCFIGVRDDFMKGLRNFNINVCEHNLSIDNHPQFLKEIS